MFTVHVRGIDAYIKQGAYVIYVACALGQARGVLG